MSWLVFLRLVRRSWWIVAFTVLGVVGSTALWTSRQTRVYEGSTTAIVWPDESAVSQQKETVLRSLDTLDRRSVIATYAKIPSSRTIRQQAKSRLNLSSSDLGRCKIRTSVMPDTNVLRISVEGPTPQLVAALANAVAEESNVYATTLSAIYRLKILDQATEPTRPIRPLVLRSLSSGAAVGLLLGLGWVFLFGYVRQSRYAHEERLAVEPEENFPAAVRR